MRAFFCLLILVISYVCANDAVLKLTTQAYDGATTTIGTSYSYWSVDSLPFNRNIFVKLAAEFKGKVDLKIVLGDDPNGAVTFTDDETPGAINLAPFNYTEDITRLFIGLKTSGASSETGVTFEVFSIISSLPSVNQKHIDIEYCCGVSQYFSYVVTEAQDEHEFDITLQTSLPNEPKNALYMRLDKIPTTECDSEDDLIEDDCEWDARDEEHAKLELHSKWSIPGTYNMMYRAETSVSAHTFSIEISPASIMAPALMVLGLLFLVL